MNFTHSVAIIRTRKDSVVGCHMIFTRRYANQNKNQFKYTGYACSEFHIGETVGGNVIVTTFDVMERSKVKIVNQIHFENVTEIEIYTIHDL